MKERLENRTRKRGERKIGKQDKKERVTIVDQIIK